MIRKLDSGLPAVGGWADRLLRPTPVFIALVVVPTLLAAIYYLLLASPIYVSEAQFIVRKTDQTPSASNVSSALQVVGLGASDTDAFAVQQYMLSRNAVTALDGGRALRAALAPSGADFLMRFPRPFEKASRENLFKAYKRFVSIGYDGNSGISTLTVSAFQPKDAQTIAASLIRQGEVLVNTLNTQAEEDAITEARDQVAKARLRVAEAQAALGQYRNREGIVDPARSSAADLELIGRLSVELATLRAERNGLASTAPQSPQLPVLDDRIRAYQQQVEAARAKMTGEAGSLASKIGAFEQLSQDRDLAMRALNTAVLSEDSALIEAQRKRLHLQVIVQPDIGDSPVRPRRWRALATVLVSTLLAYATVMLVLAGLREHRQ